MGAVIDCSTCAAFYRFLTDQSFVQLERETNAHFYLSLAEDMLSQPFWDKSLLQGFPAAAQVLANLDKSERKNVCLAASSHKNNTIGNDNCQHTRPVTTDQLQTSRHHFLIHDRFWVQCSILGQISCLCQCEQPNMIPMSRSAVGALNKDECLRLMEQLGEGHPRRGGVLVVDLKAMLKGSSLLERDSQRRKGASWRTKHDSYRFPCPKTTREDT